MATPPRPNRRGKPPSAPATKPAQPAPAAQGDGVGADARLVPLAEVARPHGVRGELRLKLYNRDSDLLLSLDQVVLQHPDGERNLVDLVEVRRANDAMLVRLNGCDDRDHADELRGALILAPRDAFPEPDEGEFYVCDIVGAQVVAPQGEVGTVEDVLSYPTCDAIAIRTPGGERLELPLVDGVVEAVDVAARQVRVTTRDPLGSE